MPQTIRSQLIFLTWLAAFLRLPSLFANHFHADEALFASWARLIAVWRDPLLQTQAVDKPPLLFYLQALFYPQYGPVEWAARMPNWIGFLLLVPLVGMLAWRLFGDGVTAVASATFITLNPLTVQFSATAFTDPLLTTFLTFALLFSVCQEIASGHRSASKLKWAGLFFGLAVATKYQAWLFLPLMFVFWWTRSGANENVLGNRPGARGDSSAVGAMPKRPWRRNSLSYRNLPGSGLIPYFMLILRGFLPVMLLLLLWIMARWGSPGLWQTQMRNFGGLQPIEFQMIWIHLLEWLALIHLALGGWTGTILISLSLLLLLVKEDWVDIVVCSRLVQSSRLNQSHKDKAFLGICSRSDLILILFIVSYLILHWLLEIPAWARYLLPIMPLVALLFGRGVGRGWRLVSWRKPVKTGLWVIVLVVMFFMGQIAWEARNGRFPFGGQPNGDHGAHQIADYLSDAPYGTVLYDHWYSWTLRYHFFDKGVYVSWFPDSADLAENLQVFGEREGAHYIALPDTAVALPIQQAVTQAGFQLRTILQTDTTPSMTLYRIEKDQS